MPLLSRISSLWRNLTHKQRVDEELDEELRACLEILAEQKMKSGLSPAAARRVARIELGGVEQVKEQVREVRLGSFLEIIGRDLTYGLRSLLKSPGVTAVAVLSLALGIGLNSAIFTAINAVLLRPFPYMDPERLVHLGSTEKNFENGTRPQGISPADYLDWQARNHVFESMAIYDSINRYHILSGWEEGERVGGYHVSANFFSVLGVQPVLGRDFLPEEDRPGADVVILGHDLWRRKFFSDRDVVGRQMIVDGRSRTIVGVMGEGFRFYEPLYRTLDPIALDLWLPYAFENNPPSNRQYYINSAIARLKPGVSIEQARAEMGIIAQELALEYPEANKDSGIWVGTCEEFYGAPSMLLLAWGTVILVLVISCANVANLFLVRTEARRQEIALRMAIGAGRVRIVRQLLTESLLLGVGGGLCAVTLAVFGTEVISVFLPEAKQMRRLDEASVDGSVLAFTLLIAVSTGLLCGLLPALRGSRVTLARTVKESGRTTASEGPGGTRLGALVVLQVALSLVLLSGAGLMVRSLWKLHQIPLGFEPERLLTFMSQLPVGPPYATDRGFQEVAPDFPVKRRFWSITPEAIRWPERVVEQLRSLPGVEAAAAASGAPMISTHGGFRVRLLGRPNESAEESQKIRALRWWVAPNYFQALGVALVHGRDFNVGDTLASSRVAIINRFMASFYWPNQVTPLGERFLLNEELLEIVGVVDDVRAWPRREIEPQVYLPLSQNYAETDRGVSGPLRFCFLVRTHGDPLEMARVVRLAFQDVGKDVPMENVRSMDQAIAEASSSQRSTGALFGAAGLLALLLSAVGIYGVISYATALRTNEIGIRMALGASRGNVEWLVMKKGMTLVVSGMLLGSVASYGFTRLIASQLFGVTPLDPLALAAAFGVLLLVAVLACYLPARRAGGMDPIFALRWGQE